MSARSGNPQQRVEVAPEMLDQLRQMLQEQSAVVPVPPKFELPKDEPEPWSVPPPGGFAELRAALHHHDSGANYVRAASPHALRATGS